VVKNGVTLAVYFSWSKDPQPKAEETSKGEVEVSQSKRGDEMNQNQKTDLKT